MESNWSLDYCLACDKQTLGDAYCSQACRLTDLETSSCNSEPVSPSGPLSSPPSRPQGFYLEPAINFAAYKSSSTQHSPSAMLIHARTPTSTLATSHVGSSDPTPSTKTLTSSSSRSSLSSMQSNTTQGTHLSDQARSELRSYTSFFDQMRHWKSRMTTA